MILDSKRTADQPPVKKPSHRILIVDDNPGIHDDFRKILDSKKRASRLDQSEAILFGESEVAEALSDLQIDSAYQGQEALVMVEQSLLQEQPYCLAFVDVRMPPGLDGVETVSQLWKIDPRVQVVLCTAYSDYSWNEIVSKLDRTDRLLILKKPFDTLEVHQLVCSLTEKWNLTRNLDAHVENLEKLVHKRTAELAASLSMIKATLEATADGILVINKNLAVVTFNKRFLEMWKIPPLLAESGDYEKILNLVISQITSEDFLTKLQRWDYATRAKEFELLKFQDGRVFECCAHPQTIDETIVGNVWSFRDVTKRVQLEEHFRQAQKMECVGQLAGGVAHDFNNLLTIIQGYAAFLNETVRTDEKESVQEIILASQRAAGLTRQLLTFSRRQVIQRLDLNLHQVIYNISKMLRRLVGEDIQFEVEFSAELPSIHADVGMVEQILMNLAVNSRDAMPNGGRFTIRANGTIIDAAKAAQSPDALTGEFVCLEISDTGCGIKPDDLLHIFEPFFTTKDVGKGTGLGLATVYGIVKQHKGWITVQSTIGQGTTFKIYLPAVKSKADQAVKPVIPAKTVGGHETILLVEDEMPVRGLVARILQDLGYKVLEAESAVKALEVKKQFPGKIHLLLTDMIMPEGMSGRELADRLETEAPEIKVIFTSGYSPDIFGKDIVLQPGRNFLQKPYPPEELARAIRNCLDKNRPQAERS
jgi:two-component system, cell cycle sensor histidine kinase and response regulator CckA